MELIIIIVAIIASVIIYFNMSMNKKELEKLALDKELNTISEKIPENIEICKNILKKVKNEKVKVEEDKESKTSLYIAISDKIIIADVKNSYTRIQTIAHECLHSIQDRRIQIFNFIFSNIYIIYFIITAILAIFNKIQNSMLYLSIMLILSYTYYFIRSYLEDDAMIKAKYLAKEYLEETKISSPEEINSIIQSYEKINNIGIKTVNFQIMLQTLIKTIILAIAFLI